MVSKVTLPDGSEALLKEVIESKTKFKNFYSAIKSDMLKQARLYVDSWGCPSHVYPMDIHRYTANIDEAEDRTKTLRNLYNAPKDVIPHGRLEDLRKNNGLNLCPSCGELGRPRTLDHYLPKNIFPELAILLANLTPMCDWCQGEKSDKYKTEVGSKLFLHPYFDEVDRPLYNLAFSGDPKSPKFTVVVCDELDDNLKSLVITHLDGINLHERYAGYFVGAYTRIVRHARSFISIDVFRKYLEDTLSYNLLMSHNSWDAVFYRSILQDEAIMEYLAGIVFSNTIEKL